MNKLNNNLKLAKESLIRKQNEASEAKEQNVKAKSTHEEIQLLAQIAMRHLSNKCPVCTQEINRDVVESHLQELVSRKVDLEENLKMRVDVMTYGTQVHPLIQNRIMEEQVPIFEETER